MRNFNCSNNKLTELDLTNCTELIGLNCFGNKLTELDLTNCEKLGELHCHSNELTELDLTNCTRLGGRFFCDYNKLTKLDLTGLGDFYVFDGSNQSPSLTLYETEAGEYARTISLNKPTFGNNSINYYEGILKSPSNTVSETSFTVQTGKAGYELSGTMSFTYSNVGINPAEKTELKVYPNPTKGELTIKNEKLEIKSVEIFDVMGKKVQSSEFKVQSSETRNPKSETLNISNLPAGIYFLRITTDKGVITKKIVKQ
jgi:hypothetical protein